MISIVIPTIQYEPGSTDNDLFVVVWFLLFIIMIIKIVVVIIIVIIIITIIIICVDSFVIDRA